MSFFFRIWLCAVLALIVSGAAFAQSNAQPASAAVRVVGAVSAIDGSIVTVASDSGSATRIAVQGSTQMVRTAPGQKDLKSATPIALKDLQVGDRVFVRAAAPDPAAPPVATSLIVMRKADIAEKQQRDLSEWQEHGVGGLVTAIDAAAGAITVSNIGFGSRQISVHTSPSTVVRRYAPGSIRFDDAKPAKLEDVQRGDQLRARGNRSTNGMTIAADEIVFGSFRNLAGHVTAVDAAHNTLELQDLLSKKKVTVLVSLDSQLRKLPQMMAERIATRLKSEAAAPPEPANTAAAEGAPVRRFAGARADFQQMLSRVPQVTLGDLQKGDVILIVATESQSSAPPAAITVVAGAEPILTAAPERAATLLSPWNLGGGAGDAGGGGLP